MPVFVLALNPSIDAEWRVDEVRWQEKNVIQSERRWAGGKGVNVARWLHHLSIQARLLIPLGGATGTELARQLREERLRTTIVPLRDPTRVNVIVTTARARQLRFNPLGPKLSALEWRKVFDETRKQFRSARSVIFSGSLPRSAPVETYERLIRMARKANCRTLLDCDGPAFVAGIRAQPFLVKPNEPELAQWYGRALTSERSIVQAALALSEATGGWVLISRAERGGILLNAAEAAGFIAHAPRVNVVNTVGAGDALLAGVARQIEHKSPPAEWLRWGIATGTAATQYEAGKLPKPAEINRLAGLVKVRPF